MRVAVVAECFLPEINGVTNSVTRVLDHLHMRGHDAIVVAPGPGPTHYRDYPLVRVPGPPLPFYPSLRVGLPTRAMSRAIRRFQPDVMHVAAPALLGGGALRLAQAEQIPSVAIYQTDFVGFARRYRLRIAAPALRRLLRYVHSMADLTLAPSTAAVWQLRSAGVDRVSRWGRGVDLDQFSPVHRSDSFRRQLAGGEVIVGTVGRLAAEKRLQLLAPITHMKGVTVVIVGDGPRRKQLESRLPQAHFLGFQQGRELSRSLASFDVFVHTGKDETFCQAIQEALAAGVPVVAPAQGGPLDLVRHDQNGYVYPADDQGAMCSAVQELVCDPVRRQRFGQRAHEQVSRNSWTSVGDALLHHYASVTTTRTHRLVA